MTREIFGHPPGIFEKRPAIGAGRVEREDEGVFGVWESR